MSILESIDRSIPIKDIYDVDCGDGKCQLRIHEEVKYFVEQLPVEYDDTDVLRHMVTTFLNTKQILVHNHEVTRSALGDVLWLFTKGTVIGLRLIKKQNEHPIE